MEQVKEVKRSHQPLCNGMASEGQEAPFSEAEHRHKTGPQGTDLAENPPMLTKIGREIRFLPPRGPGRPKTPRVCVCVFLLFFLKHKIKKHHYYYMLLFYTYSIS